MNYLVTGGAGFIGSNLTEDLVKKGHKVLVVDNLSTGSFKNLAAVKGKIKFVKARAGRVLKMKECRNLNGIFHLGIPSTTALYRRNRSLVGKSISEFTEVLELARKENCKLAYASSSSLYNGNRPPFREDQPIFVKDFYTESRFLMERLAKLYFDFYGVNSTGLRLFSVYGPGEEAKKDFANLVSQFLWEMKKGKPPLIYGNGRQTRDFTYVGDVVRGFKLAMALESGCHIFNIGTGEYHTLNELVGILNKTLNKNIKPVYVGNPLKNYVEQTLADTSKAKKILGFKAEIPLEKGINLLPSLIA